MLKLQQQLKSSKKDTVALFVENSFRISHFWSHDNFMMCSRQLTDFQYQLQIGASARTVVESVEWNGAME